MKYTFTKFLSMALLASSCFAQGTLNFLVVPNGLENKEGNSGSGGVPFNQDVPIRYQQLYSASQFQAAMPTGGWIYGMSFRLDKDAVRDVLPVQVKNFEINASTTLVTPQTINPSSYVNAGPDEVVVLPNDSGFTLQATHGTTPNPFSLHIPFANPFLYDPHKGSLLLDMTVHTPFRIKNIVDAEGTSATFTLGGDLGSSFPLLTGFGSYVAQFDVRAVPEPTILALILIGMLGFIVVKGRRR
jgi:hypothetical protein